MIKNKQVKYLRVRGKELWIKYKGKGNETFLTRGKVDLKNFANTQRIYYDKAQLKTRLKAELRKSQSKKRREEEGQPYWLELKKIAIASQSKI